MCRLRNTALHPGSLRLLPASRWSRRRRIISEVRLWSIVRPDVGPDPRFKPGSTPILSAPTSRWFGQRTPVPIAIPLALKALTKNLHPDGFPTTLRFTRPRGKNRAGKDLCGSGLDRRLRNGQQARPSPLRPKGGMPSVCLLKRRHPNLTVPGNLWLEKLCGKADPMASDLLKWPIPRQRRSGRPGAKW